MELNEWMKDFQEKNGRLPYADEVFEGGKLAEREQSKDMSKHFVDRWMVTSAGIPSDEWESYIKEGHDFTSEEAAQIYICGLPKNERHRCMIIKVTRYKK